MYIIGLTGNIGTGKSTVGHMLAGLGARYIDADEVAHQTMRQGTATYRAVVAEFGAAILGPDGEIDRRKLGAVVFSGKDRLKRLEEIVHPAVFALAGQLIEEATEAVVVLDAIKLVESGMAGVCDVLWVVTCPRVQQVQRLVRTRGLSRQQALLRIRAQPPQQEKIARADVVIDNGRSLAATQDQVERAWRSIPGLHSPTPLVAL